MSDARDPMPLYFFECDPADLADAFVAWGLKAFRAKQVVQWVYERGVWDFDDMTNLSRADRAVLRERLVIESGEAIRHQLATDGTQKLLIAWDDLAAPSSTEAEENRVAPDSTAATLASNAAPTALPLMGGAGGVDFDPRPQTECVMIPSDSRASGRKRQTACISSQVGCPVGCRFCASGLGGLERNLVAGRIVEQVWRLGRLEGVGRITNVVFMGMGEPLANFAAVAKALRHITADWGLGISARRITVSTVGVPSGIRRLAEIDLPVTLAISLHAPNDEVRRRIIPWAEFVSIDQLIDAGRYYFDKTGREITLEYILLGGVNDRPEHARELARVARKLRSNVNLIRYNEVKGLEFNRPASEDVHRFREILDAANVNVHIRASRGRDIAAACGQLRHESRPPSVATR
ncbi:MAG: 23S rRNA (adenine(2503)-C(2))-methyltransferase RlmN [Phycisphaeraceae bacterium]